MASYAFEASDAELWSQAQRHDGHAFGSLFERHVSSVYNHCFQRTGSWSAAEDLVGVVFLEAWRREERGGPRRRHRPAVVAGGG